MLPIAAPVLTAAFVVTVAAAVTQGSIGFGFAVLSVPILALVDPALAPVPQMIIELPLVWAIVWRERADVDWPGVFWVLVGRLPGAALGVLLVAVAGRRLLDLSMAAAVLAAVVILASGASLARNRATQLGVGLASGVMSYVSAIGGPPIALLYRDASGPTIRASLGVIFSVGMAITLGARLVAGHVVWRDVEIALWLLPAVALGFWISHALTNRVEGEPLRRAILALATLAGIGLLARALTG